MQNVLGIIIAIIIDVAALLVVVLVLIYC